MTATTPARKAAAAKKRAADATRFAATKAQKQAAKAQKSAAHTNAAKDDSLLPWGRITQALIQAPEGWTSTQRMEAFGIERIVELMASGYGYRAVSTAIGVNVALLHRWINSDWDRAKAVNDARQLSAYLADEMALDELRAIKDNASQAAVARQREIASHLRWRAKTRDPSGHGDHIDVKANVSVNPLASLMQYVAENGKPLLVGNDKTTVIDNDTQEVRHERS